MLNDLNAQNPGPMFAAFAAANPGPFSAIGKVVAVGAVTKNKRAGGTYQVQIATLDTGVEVDFGFKPPVAAVGADVSWIVKKEYGSYKFVNEDPTAGSLSPAFPARAPSLTGSPPPTYTATGATSTGPFPARAGFGGAKPFPLPRDHGDTAIIRQNSLTNAVATIANVLRAPSEDAAALGVIPAEYKRLRAMTPDQLSDEIIKIAYKYASFSSGHIDAMLVEGIAAAAGASKPAA